MNDNESNVNTEINEQENSPTETLETLRKVNESLSKAVNDNQTTISDLKTKLEKALETIYDFKDKIYSSDDLRKGDLTTITLEDMIKSPNILKTRFEKEDK